VEASDEDESDGSGDERGASVTSGVEDVGTGAVVRLETVGIISGVSA